MASTPFAGATRRLKDGRFSLGTVINAEFEQGCRPDRKGGQIRQPKNKIPPSENE